MKAQKKETKEIFQVFAMRPGKIIILDPNGRQVLVDEQDYTLDFENIKSSFCQCENRKEQPEIRCPLDGDPCNCCNYCQNECIKINAK